MQAQARRYVQLPKEGTATTTANTFARKVMAVRSLSEVKQQLCRLVPGWVTATVRVALLIDLSENQEPNVGKQCSMHLHKHTTVHPLSKTCASKAKPQ